MTTLTIHPAPSWMTLGGFITAEGLDELARFKFHSGAYSTLDNFLNPWWLWLARRVPRQVSPNAVTLSGLVSMSLALVLQLHQLESSSWVGGHNVQILVALSIFAYQTLDAVDGKHARNTGQSTPLGAIFDHGCDAIAILLVGLMVELAMTHPDPGTEVHDASLLGALSNWLPAVSFFFAQWESHLTASMEVGGVTEAQFCGIGVALGSAWRGPAGFQADVLSLLPAALVPEALRDALARVSVKRMLALLTVIFAGTLCTSSLTRCLRRSVAPVWRIAAPILACLTYLGACMLVYAASSGVFEQHRMICLTAAHLGFADLNIRMILASVGQFGFPLLHLAFLPFTLSALGAWCVGDGLGARQHAALLCAVATWQVVSVLWLASDTISRVCAKLEIPFLAPVHCTSAKDNKQT